MAAQNIKSRNFTFPLQHLYIHKNSFKSKRKNYFNRSFFFKLKTAFLVYGGFGLSRSRIFHSWRRHHYRWGADNFFLYSELMAIEQRLFFSVPHLLWQGTSLYMVTSKDTWNSHLLPPRRWRRGLERWHSKRKVGCDNLSRDKPKS